MSASKTIEGTVKWYNFRKGFGFIQTEDGGDCFVHATALRGTTSLREGDKVSFEIVETEKGKQAKNVTLLQKASDMTKEEQEEQEEQEE